MNRAIRGFVEIASLILIELAVVVFLHRLGTLNMLQIDWSNVGFWLESTPAEDALAAVVRLVALAIAYYLLAASTLYALAASSRIPGAVRAVEWMTLPVLRRAIDKALVAGLVGSSVVGGGAGVAMASTSAQADGRVGIVAAVTDTGVATPGASTDSTLPTDLSGPILGVPTPHDEMHQVEEADETTTTTAPSTDFLLGPPPPAASQFNDDGPAAASTQTTEAPTTTTTEVPTSGPPNSAFFGIPTTSSSAPETTTPPDTSQDQAVEDEGPAEEQASAPTPTPTPTPQPSAEPTREDLIPTSNEVLGSQTHRVEQGQNLWGIAEAHLAANGRGTSDNEVRDYWMKVIDANRANLLSGNPDMIYTGESITLPSL